MAEEEATKEEVEATKEEEEEELCQSTAPLSKESDALAMTRQK